ncbi:hypothetical protein BDN72DRAFT_749963, partial [Pluteus cervinus]
MRLVYLPAYSPDLNPIEEAFSAIKAHLRQYRNYARAGFADIEDLIYEIIYRSVSPDKAWGWFHHCSY